uniref:HuD protein n=1 Tax=Homo sapiens TaxID=9606 RepID=Q16234_HUMAN
MVMPSRILKLT